MFINMDNILTVADLNVYYKNNTGRIAGEEKRTHVLHDISFQMKRGEVLGIVGESGCGKSTLVKTILGMVKAQSGEIQHYSKQPQMVFQDPYSSLNPVKKVSWLLEEPLKLNLHLSKEERLERVIQMLERVGLGDEIADRYPRQLSGGQRQRVAIACALMLSPELLIADEPVSALDVTIQAQIIELMQKLHEEMCLSMLFISHDLRVVYQICDRIMIMKQGQIVESGCVEEVYFSPQHEYTKTLLDAAGIGIENS